MKRRKIAAAAVFLAAALLLASCTGGESDQLGEISEGFGSREMPSAASRARLPISCTRPCRPAG